MNDPAKMPISAGEGAHHWRLQRISALALLPLSLWFIWSVLPRVTAGYDEVAAWVATPAHALLLLLYLGFMFFHAQLGLQVVIEDYVHTAWRRWAMLLAVKGALLLAAAAAMFSVLFICLRTA